uniref:Uncharacterized protein n=1 Tax=Panagrolaimus sp. JU765 TaxID=591449 RepID=A0AC34PYS2_9BILA
MQRTCWDWNVEDEPWLMSYLHFGQFWQDSSTDLLQRGTSTFQRIHADGWEWTRPELTWTLIVLKHHCKQLRKSLGDYVSSSNSCCLTDKKDVETMRLNLVVKTLICCSNQDHAFRNGVSIRGLREMLRKSHPIHSKYVCQTNATSNDFGLSNFSMNTADTVRVSSTIPSTSKETMLSSFAAKISRLSTKSKNPRNETKNSTFFTESEELETTAAEPNEKGW